MDYEKFKKGYDEGKKLIDCDDLLKGLSKDELQEFIDVHELVDKWTGLNMRQEYYLTIAKVIMKYRN